MIARVSKRNLLQLVSNQLAEMALELTASNNLPEIARAAVNSLPEFRKLFRRRLPEPAGNHAGFLRLDMNMVPDAARLPPS
jgi:hypothetical protein